MTHAFRLCCALALAAAPDLRIASADPPPAGRGVAIDFTGPPEGQYVKLDRVVVEFEGTDHRYDGDYWNTGYMAEKVRNMLAHHFRRNGIEVEEFEKTRLLVKGYRKGDKLYPVKEVRVESKALPKEQWPKIDPPPRREVPSLQAQIDLDPLPRMVTRNGLTSLATDAIRVRTEAADGTTYDLTFGQAHPSTATGQAERIAENMRRDGWDAQRVDGQLVIYGHKKPDGTLSPVRGVGARAAGVKDERQPSVGGIGGVKKLDLTKIESPENAK
jgi:hypothetical protein